MIVVIGILAAITIVTYNGIQNRVRAVTTKICQALVITIATPLRRATSLRLVLVLLVRERRFSSTLAKAWRHIWGLLDLIQYVSRWRLFGRRYDFSRRYFFMAERQLVI